MLLVGSSLDCSLSWLKAGVRDNELEARISEAFQEHTRGTFAVFGEFSTLLAQDPLEVTF
jgi:hypothetical protein